MTPSLVDGSATFDGRRIHWLESGTPGDPTSVLLHGARTSAHGTWDDTVPGLVPGWRLYAPDHRGHGESDWDPEANYTTSAYVADLERFVDHLGLDRFNIIGHSLGGRVGLFYAARHPDRVDGLVMVDYGPSIGPRRIPRAFTEADPLSFGSRAEAEAYVRAKFPEATRRKSLGYGLLDLADGRVGWRADVDGLARARRRPNVDPLDSDAEWAAVEAVAVPVLVLRAGRSPVLLPDAAERMAKLNSRIKVVDYPDAGHWLHQDEPERFLRDVRTFLENPPA